MAIDIEGLRPHLQSFDFPRLLVGWLGWDHYLAEAAIFHVGESDYTLKPIAEKATFAILGCSPGADGEIAKYSVRRKIEAQAHHIGQNREPTPCG